MTIFDRLRSALTGTVRLATALVLAGAVLIAGLNIWNGVRESAIAKTRTWPEVVVPSLDSARFGLKTSWRDGLLRFQLSIDGSQRFLEALKRTGVNGGIAVELLDSDGFTIVTRPVSQFELRTIVDDDGTTASLAWEGSEAVAAADVRELSKFTVSWGQIDLVERPAPAAQPSRPPQPTSPRWRTLSNWRRLSVNISDDSVRRLLGEPTRVTRYSTMVVWQYGTSFSGDVTFDSRMRVESWREPNL